MTGLKRVVIRDGVGEHPAVKAWFAATSFDRTPDYIYVRRELDAYGVYRLPGVGRGGMDVFAKRSSASRMTIERTVYEEVLSQLAVDAPYYYGSHSDGRCAWIFVEDVGELRYSEADPAHRALAARWVARFHTAAARIITAQSLPEAGPPRYLQHLRTGCERIERSVGTGKFAYEEVETLLDTVSCCKAIEARWTRVEAVCQGAPSTVVHGDFRPKNAFVRQNGSGLSLCPIDWETAGFGSPVADLMRIDLRTYWAEVHASWPEVTFDTVVRMGEGSQVLQWLAAVDWKSASLAVDVAEVRTEAVVDLVSVTNNLALAARSAGILD